MTLSAPTHAKEAGFYPIKVEKVIDGDTINAKYNNFPIKIRLYGIDAPEKTQAYGEESKKELEKILARNTDILFELLDNDRYNRKVGIIHLGKGESVQIKLIQSGSAWINAKYCTIPLCSYWTDLEKIAKQEKQGLWKENNSVPPWEWRK